MTTMTPLYYIIINPTTLEQYRHGTHEVTFDSMSEGEELLALLQAEHGDLNAGWVVVSNIDVMTMLEERLEKFFPNRRDIMLPFSQRWSTMGSTN